MTTSHRIEKVSITSFCTLAAFGEAVMTGDRLDNDIAPAELPGMKTVWVRQGFAKYQSAGNDKKQPDCTVEATGDILDILT